MPWYWPDHAGYSDPDDVNRLADYLGGIDEKRWTTLDLGGSPEDDRNDELEFLRESFPAFREMYRRARTQGQIVICETS